MHIDLNSCFATIEQQANPLLRGKPIAIAAYTTPSGCIVAPSVEAKEYGIKVGMRVKDGKKLYPDLIVMEPDPWKYRNVHLKLCKLISNYTNDFYPKSIDEFVLNMEGYLHLYKRVRRSESDSRSEMLNLTEPEASRSRRQVRDDKEEQPLKDNEIAAPPDSYRGSRNDDLNCYPEFSSGSSSSSNIGSKRESTMHKVAKEIKEKIKEEIGEWITVSIGIAPNRFLAKTASGLNKPDGLDEISGDNFEKIYEGLELTDLTGIKHKNTARLNSVGIYTVMNFYHAPVSKLRAAFNSINGYYWYLRLRGWEIDDVEFARRSYGNSYALPKPLKTPKELSPILTKLVEKMSARLRRAGYKARGVYVSVVYRDGSFWHKRVTFKKELFSSQDIYKKAYTVLVKSKFKKPVRELSVSCFKLIDSETTQLGLFEDVEKKKGLTRSIDKTNERWGDFVITPARMLYADKGAVPDRIAFGGIKELEEFAINDSDKFE